jgi:four helix bundle protein
MDEVDSTLGSQDVDIRKRIVRDFEELSVYKKARELTNGIYAVTRRTAFAHDPGLVDQLRRAAVSVVSSIAAGSERGTTKELVEALYHAKGSCGEIRAQLGIALDQKYLSTEDCGLMRDQCLLVGKMLEGLIERQQDSPKAGNRQQPPKREAASADEEWQRVINELAEQRKRRENQAP